MNFGEGANFSETYMALSLKKGWGNEDGGPKYLTWKRIFTRMINRWRMEKKTGFPHDFEDQRLEELKNYLIKRSIRRIQNQYMSRNLERLYGMLGALQVGKTNKVQQEH
jgi:hypothetical protein